MKRSKYPLVFNMERVEGETRRKGSLKSLVMGIILMGKERMALLNLVRSGFAFVVVKPMRVKLEWKE